MVATVKELEEESRAHRDSEGDTFVRVYRATGLSGATGTESMREALDHASIPQLGDAHPSDANSLVTRVDVAPTGAANEVILRVEYAVSRAESDNPVVATTGVVSFRSQAVTEVAHEDINGARLVQSWSGTIDEIFPDLLPAPISASEAFEAEYWKPVFSFDMTRTESSLSAVRALAESHTAKVNNATWESFAARTVLLVGIDLDEITSAEIRARYSFSYRPGGWDLKRYIRVYGRIPSNAVTGNGLDTFQLLSGADFSLLPVTF